ncbi:hypothetical protein WJX81_004222 [Elliptochloris bilobata]|uniref:GB1/RHD3-type G domain-containing protein n=1 Tax=Elliptochloris bilobata TaxID=381761 RepID=A0AAW1RK33_9CHLO
MAALLVLATTAAAARSVQDPGDEGLERPVPLVQPVPGGTKLQLAPEGLAVLRGIRTPVSPVVVIGPYRSGKSFMLNQLLGVGCDKGFGVGHTRATQTKGVWLWTAPQEVAAPGGGQLSVVYVDTEGFESTGKSDAYDDRIFALSALLSSVLIYNLPETIRESDIEKLSFAVQLAEGFYADAQGAAAGAVEPANMLWLIQRDFLEGKTVAAMLAEALAAVPNPTHDPDIDQVNRIRRSLGVIARNSSAFGLRQPHLERTRLCELADDQLDPRYVAQRSALRAHLAAVVKPKVVGGTVLTGPALAELVDTMVGALNARDIPTAGSILEHFNRDLVYKVREEYTSALERAALPMEEAQLEATHTAALDSALASFAAKRFGASTAQGMQALRDALVAGCEKELAARRTANTLRSGQVCEAAEVACEDVLEHEQTGALPSTGRFHARYERCAAKFEAACIGPARATQAERLARALRRERLRFTQSYNDRLFGGLVVASLAAIVVFRFVLRVGALETAAWVAFVFLQVYPKLFLNGGSMYETAWWRVLVTVWEALVYNPLIDLGACYQVVVPVTALAVLGRRFYMRYLWRFLKARRERRSHLHHDPGNGVRDLNV